MDLFEFMDRMKGDGQVYDNFIMKLSSSDKYMLVIKGIISFEHSNIDSISEFVPFDFDIPDNVTFARFGGIFKSNVQIGNVFIEPFDGETIYDFIDRCSKYEVI